MRKEQKKLTEQALLEKVQDETYWRKKATQDRIERAKKAETDSGRKTRLKLHLCKYCYYLRGDVIACSAITTTTCKICAKEMTFGSTHTSGICVDCAKKHKLCLDCLSDIDYKKRRKI